MATNHFMVTEHKVGKPITPPEYNGDPLVRGVWEFVSSDVLVEPDVKWHNTVVYVTWKRIGGGDVR